MSSMYQTEHSYVQFGGEGPVVTSMPRKHGELYVGTVVVNLTSPFYWQMKAFFRIVTIRKSRKLDGTVFSR